MTLSQMTLGIMTISFISFTVRLSINEGHFAMSYFLIATLSVVMLSAVSLNVVAPYMSALG
jgi:hypothetical protein